MLSPSKSQQDMSRFEDQVAEQGCFVSERPVWAARAPGRLDVMGGNVDYTGGMVLQGLLREAVWVAVQRRTDDTIRVLNPGAARFGWAISFQLRSGELCDPESVRAYCEEREGSRWGCYVLGALYFLKRFHRCEGGAEVFIASDLPPNKGVSSSAALEVATLKAAAAAWGISLEGVALATAGQWVENVVAGVACGIMDQAAIVLGRENHLLPMLCQPCRPFAPVTLPTGICIWGIDSMAPRSTGGAAYETARAAAFMGYRLICQLEGIDVAPDEDATIPRWTDSWWKGYLSNILVSEFHTRYERRLPESLSGREFIKRAGKHIDPFTTIDPVREYPVRAAVRYATGENLRVQRVSSLLEAAAQDGARSTLRSSLRDSLRKIGEILCQSHLAYTECGLGSAACDELVARALKAGLPGAKMTGGGAGGVVAVLGCSDDWPTVCSIAQEYARERGMIPHIFEGSSEGIDAFGVHTLQPALMRSVR
jgi:L-arabinokinase